MKEKQFVVQMEDSRKPNTQAFTQLKDVLFYSNDTDAILRFIPHEKDLDFTSANLILENLDDESLVERPMTIETIEGIRSVMYKIDSELIKHWGRWLAQVDFIKGEQKNSSVIVGFEIRRHLMDNRPPTINEVNSVNNFLTNSQRLVNQWLENETYRSQKFDELVETGLIQENIAEKLDDFVESQAPELANLSAQLAQTKQAFNDSVSQVTVDSEVILARGGKTTLGSRIDEIVAGDGLENGAVTPSKTSFLRQGDGLNIATDFINSYIGGDSSAGFTYIDNHATGKSMIVPIEPNTKYSVVFNGSTSNAPKLTTTPQLLTHNQKLTSTLVYASDTGRVIESGSNDSFLYFSFIPNETLPFVKIVKSDVIMPIVDSDTKYFASGFRVENITPNETTFARFSDNSEERNYETRNFSEFHNPANDGRMIQANGTSVSTESTTNYTYTLPIPVVGGAKYEFAYRSYCIFNKDNQPIGFENFSGYGVNPNIARIVTIPSDARYIVVNFFISHVSTAKISRRTAIGNERSIVINNLELPTKKTLINKNILIIGDSLNANYNPNISDIIADKTGATVINGALGGSRLCFRPDDNGYGDGSTGSQVIRNLISGDWTTTIDDINDRRTGDLLTKQLATVEVLQSVNLSNIDLVIIAYGTNDRLQSRAIGSDIDDESKFQGALRIGIETLLSNYNHLKIMFVGQPFSFRHNDNANFYGEYEINNSGHMLGDYVEAMREVADKYHVGFLDNYTNGGMNDINKLYYFYSNDGIHGKSETFVPLLASRYIRKIEDILA